VFFILSTINIAASYLSVKVIDEIHLNNQRAFILFNEYFKTNQDKIMSVVEAND